MFSSIVRELINENRFAEYAEDFVAQGITDVQREKWYSKCKKQQMNNLLKLEKLKVSEKNEFSNKIRKIDRKIELNNNMIQSLGRQILFGNSDYWSKTIITIKENNMQLLHQKQDLEEQMNETLKNMELEEDEILKPQFYSDLEIEKEYKNQDCDGNYEIGEETLRQLRKQREKLVPCVVEIASNKNKISNARDRCCNIL